MRKILKKFAGLTPFYPIAPAGSTIQWLHFWREVKRLPMHRFQNVLDAGFGPGHYASELARRYPHLEITGYDLKLPSENGHPSNVHFSKQDLKEMADQDVFDFIYSIEVLEHIPGNRPVFQNLYRALRPGGYLYLHLPNDKLTRWLLPSHWFKRYSAWADVEHIGEQYSLTELTALLKESGFSIEKAAATFGHFGELLDEADELVRQALPTGFKFVRMAYAPLMKFLCWLAVALPTHWGNNMVVAQKPLFNKTLSNPLVSVLIATYNSAHLVGRALKSVLEQTYQNFEIIIIDEASKDDIESVVNRLEDSRITLHRYTENTGLGGARNKGIRLAKGEAICFLDADDAWHPQKLEKQVKAFEDTPLAGVIYCGIEYRKDGALLGYRKPKCQGDIFKTILGEHVVGNATTYMIRKECFDQVGLFDESLRTYGEDWELMIRMARRYPFNFCPEPLAYYYFHSSHKSGELVDRPLKSMPDRFSILQRNQKDYDSNHKAYSVFLRRIGVDYCKGLQCATGRRFIWQSIQKNFLSWQGYVALVSSLLGSKAFYHLWFWTSVFRRKVHSVALIRSVGTSPVANGSSNIREEELTCKS